MFSVVRWKVFKPIPARLWLHQHRMLNVKRSGKGREFFHTWKSKTYMNGREMIGIVRSFCIWKFESIFISTRYLYMYINTYSSFLFRPAKRPFCGIAAIAVVPFGSANYSGVVWRCVKENILKINSESPVLFFWHPCLLRRILPTWPNTAFRSIWKYLWLHCL